MNNLSRTLVILFILAFINSQVFAEEYRYENGKKQSSGLKETAAGCAPASAYDWLDINNVRARINTGGDMWWDLPGGTGAKYYIPKAGSATSMFSGALWIGGLDINNQLKLAAQRYRQVGIDYWTGPLTIDGTAAIDEATCAQYDRFAKITRAEVDEFISNTDPETGFFVPSEEYDIPPSIMEWPAHGDVSKNQSYYLAPFYDNDGDGEYDPFSGDYPYYDIENELCQTDIPTLEEEFQGTITGSILADQVIKGDQTLWWVFNDKGNIHTETDGSAIGMEIRAQAFAFATNDEINNMTFYSYEIINRSTFVLTETFFSPWVDTDLGYARDDFVGCDVARGLGYCYNGTAVDGSGEPESYGGPQPPPPAIGVDFFQGPYMDPDGYDNPGFGGFGDGPRFVDDPSTPDIDERCQIVSKNGVILNMLNGDGTIEPTKVVSAGINGVNFGNGIKDDERFGMRRFVYHNNSGGNQGDPQIAPQYYNYLKGIWKDGTKMLYGGTAYAGGAGTVGPECDFMFPGDTDPCNWGTGGIPPNGGYTQNGLYWTEETGDNGGPNPPEDRRFMQSAGPFTLKPGAVNYITVGIPWARATAGDPFSSVELLRTVDDKCQALFDNCFKVIDGPSAPDLTIRELDKELIFYISNSPSSNNYQEKYQEFDPNIVQPLPGGGGERSDSIYRFEGYQIFQLKNDEVGVESIHDPDLVRLVAQFDIDNGVGKLVNYYYDEFINGNVPVVEVVGGDDGIQHSFVLTQDAFATGDVRLINNKTYYYMALAYAYNEYLPYSPGPDNYLGQKTPYLSGRKNIKTYSAMPHYTINGTVIGGSYGESPEITRIAGNGNGGLYLDLKDETIEEILSKPPAGPDNIYGSPDYPMAYNPVYKENAGPLNVKVIDPLNVVSTTFTWWMDTLEHVIIPNITNDGAIQGDTASKFVGKWYLLDHTSGITYATDTTIIVENEVLFPELGISINARQPYYPGPIPIGKVEVDNSIKTARAVLAQNNGLISASIEYADSSQRWLSGVFDEDIPGYPLDWIRSGTYEDGDNPSQNDWQMGTSPDNPWDPDEAYEKILNGTWAPYSLAASGNSFFIGDPLQSIVGPAYSRDSRLNSPFDEVSSIDIVFTPDKTKWTRAVVLEMSFDSLLAQGKAKRFQLRRSPSIDKDGNFATMGEEPSENEEAPNYISSHGMGWFPGYAINVETGERLNIMYGEDSYLVAENGRDMQFNPPSKNLDLAEQYQDPFIIKDTISFTPVLGGKHYVYIMKTSEVNLDILPGEPIWNFPAYDAGKNNVTLLDSIFDPVFPWLPSYFFENVMYVGIPMGVKGQDWLSNEAKIRIRVSKPYARGYGLKELDTVYPGMDVNNYYPMYQFSMEGLSTQFNDPQKLETDLDEINVVPNPYYAYSSYENNPLDNRIKITNLPEKCTVTIYNVSGTKIRQFKKDTPETTIEWDMKNFAAVPISGGVYYIHTKSEQGERVIKWFCVMRVPDLNTF
jgi:hypothetical protein